MMYTQIYTRWIWLVRWRTGGSPQLGPFAERRSVGLERAPTELGTRRKRGQKAERADALRFVGRNWIQHGPRSLMDASLRSVSRFEYSLLCTGRSSVKPLSGTGGRVHFKA